MTETETIRARIGFARKQGRYVLALTLSEIERLLDAAEGKVIPLKSRNPATAKWDNRVKLEVAE